jgi:hypothetical protein
MAQAVAGEWVDAQLKMVSDLKDEAIGQMSSLTKDPDLLQQARCTTTANRMLQSGNCVMILTV